MKHTKKHKRFLIFAIVCASVIFYLYSYVKDKAINTVPKDGKMVLTVKLDSINQILNGSVGNEWSFEASVNGTSIGQGDTLEVTVTPNSKINFNAIAVESDTRPDVGSNSNSITVKDLKLSEQNNWQVYVNVTENAGRYTGNTAQWRFNFNITRKIDMNDIVASIFE